MNRHRRRAEKSQRRREAADDLVIAPNRSMLLGVVAALAETHDSLSGITVIMPNGQIDYIDAAMLRRGGRA
jgi:phage-related protein